jgi:hypothetical protein
MGSKTILLVEDNPDDALFAQRAFAKLCPDAGLSLARDGEVAVNYLSGQGQYDPSAPWVVRNIRLYQVTGQS